MKNKFDSKVYQIVALIPSGKVATYGQIADLFGAYGCARQVGWSLRRLVLPSSIPWHRVINARGEISMSISRNGTDWIQRDLLLKEGIILNNNFKINLRHYEWRPDTTFIESYIEFIRFK